MFFMRLAEKRAAARGTKFGGGARSTKEKSLVLELDRMGRSDEFALEAALEQMRLSAGKEDKKDLIKAARDGTLTAAGILKNAADNLARGGLSAAFQDLTQLAMHKNCTPKGDEVWRFCELVLEVASMCPTPANVAYLAHNWLQHIKKSQGGAEFLMVSFKVAEFYFNMGATGDRTATINAAMEYVKEHTGLETTSVGVEVWMYTAHCFFDAKDMIGCCAALEKVASFLREIEHLDLGFKCQIARKMAVLHGEMQMHDPQMAELLAAEFWAMGALGQEVEGGFWASALPLTHPERVACLKKLFTTGKSPKLDMLRGRLCGIAFDKANLLAHLLAFEAARAELEIVFMLDFQGIGPRLAESTIKLKERVDAAIGTDLSKVACGHLWRRCADCAVIKEDLLPCPCNTVWYCSVGCQGRDWASHKPNCSVCAQCEKAGPGFKRCSRCKSVRYCSQECAAAHWTEHKPVCVAPFSVKKEPAFFCADCTERTAAAASHKE